MNFKTIILGVLISTAYMSYGQTNLLNAKIPEEIGVKTDAQLVLDNDKPLEYGYVDDRDILFGKMTWEKIVLDERINFPLLYPIDENVSLDRKPLFTVLWDAINEGYIGEVYADSYFREVRTIKQIEGILNYSDITEQGTNYLNDKGYGLADYEADPSILPEEYKIISTLSPADISEYLIKGFWYFDKRQGEMKYRLLAIAPTAPEARFKDSDDPLNRKPIPLFWVFFPEARDVLHEAKSFNNKNSALPVSFDHLLNSRRFNGYMYEEENVYGDREVSEYISDNALMQLLESDRIKDKIRNFEQDMWSY
jgi:gliding motility associated protien GldN